MKKKLWLIVAVIMLFSVFSVPATASAATIKLNKKSITIEAKEAYTLKVSGTSKKVNWSSSNKKIAKVSSKGVVTGVKKGDCKITAKVGKKKLTCKVTVGKAKLNKTSIAIEAKEKYTLKLSGTQKKVKWTSSNKKIANVSSKGVVTGVKNGTCKITANYGKKKLVCKVTVGTAKLNKKTLSIETKGKYTLKVSGTQKKVTWSSSNKGIATVNSKGVVTGVKKGTCNITAKYGSKKLVCKVTVKNPDIAVTSIALSETYLTMKEGEQKALTVKYTPSNATTGKNITWTSSNNNVATVSQAGVVTAKKMGLTPIEAKTENGKRALCQVIVEPNIIEIPITSDNVNEYFEIKETFMWEENAFGEAKGLVWSYEVCLKDEYVDRICSRQEFYDAGFGMMGLEITASDISFEYEWDNKDFYPVIDFDNRTHTFTEASQTDSIYDDTSTTANCDGNFYKKDGYCSISSGFSWTRGHGVSKGYSDEFTVTREENHRFTRAEGILVLRK